MGKVLYAVMHDFDETHNFGDGIEMIARTSVIAKRMGMGFTGEQMAAYERVVRHYPDLFGIMIDDWRKVEPNYSGTVEACRALDRELTGQFDNLFWLAPGSRELFRDLATAKIPSGMVTGRDRTSLMRLMNRHGLILDFPIIYARDEFEKKPSQEGPRRCMAELCKLLSAPSYSAAFVARVPHLLDHPNDVRASLPKQPTIYVGNRALDGVKPTYHVPDMHEARRVLEMDFGLKRAA